MLGPVRLQTDLPQLVARALEERGQQRPVLGAPAMLLAPVLGTVLVMRALLLAPLLLRSALCLPLLLLVVAAGPPAAAEPLRAPGTPQTAQHNHRVLA